MAHWGMAMSLWHQLWNHPNAATIKRASAELKAADKAKAPTERERDYIQALEAFFSNSKKADNDARARRTPQPWRRFTRSIQRTTRRRLFMRSRCWGGAG